MFWISNFDSMPPPKHTAPSELPKQETKKRQALSLGDKLQIIKLASENSKLKHEDIAIKYGCGRSTVTKVLREKEKWLEEGREGVGLTVQKRREAHWERMEQALIVWVNQASSRNMIINDEIIRTKAKDFAAAIYNPDDPLSDFSASDGWLYGFKSRHGLKSYRLHGEAASAPVENLEASRSKLREILAPYALENIFNADETGLFFRMLPNQTLATSVRKGTKKDKDRITLLLATNATGTEKLKPMVIGKSAQPR